MLEYEKYQDLQAKTQKTQEEYERQITELENRKEEEVTRQRMQYTAQLEKLKNDLILVCFFISVKIRCNFRRMLFRSAKRINNNLVIMKKLNGRLKKMPMKKF
jgi:dsDNA-specific endonuclease/ATPase MutS2